MTKKCVKKISLKDGKKDGKKTPSKINSNTLITNKFRNNLLLDHNDDEDEIVEWSDDNINETKEYFDCGCCDDCLCDDNIECANCGCNCNGDDFDEDCEDCEDCDFDDDIEDSESEFADGNLSNFNINIVKDETNEKLVRITLQLNVMLDNKKTEIINIDLDINSKTYLKIAEELFKK
jgi:hypothetical protein